MLASGTWDKTIKLWDVETGKDRATLKGHGDVVMGVAFSPNGKMLASASFDRSVKLWDIPSAVPTGK
jgi:WD40 repeat protein